MKSLAFFLVVLACTLVSAQEALQHLSSEQTAEIEKKLSDFKCPEGASKVACKSFQELVESRDSETLTPFLPVVLPKNIAVATTYLVFDDDTDTFWIIASWGYDNGGPKVDILYTMFQNGMNHTAVTDTIPFVKDKVIKMSKEGVTVSFDGDSLVFLESYTNASKSLISAKTTVKLSTLRTETAWAHEANTHLSHTRAVKFANDN
jgi:hypothetical protein